MNGFDNVVLRLKKTKCDSKCRPCICERVCESTHFHTKSGEQLLLQYFLQITLIRNMMGKNGVLYHTKVNNLALAFKSISLFSSVHPIHNGETRDQSL